MAGLRLSEPSPDGRLVSGGDHRTPLLWGVQFHPEFRSVPPSSPPLFRGFCGGNRQPERTSKIKNVRSNLERTFIKLSVMPPNARVPKTADRIPRTMGYQPKGLSRAFSQVHQETDAQQGDYKGDKAYQDSGLRTGKESLASSDLLGEKRPASGRSHPPWWGMARKKENSAATGRAQPKMIAPKMVAPEREVPGMMDRAWNRPMHRAICQVRSLVRRIAGVRRRSSIMRKPHAVDDQSSGYHPGFIRCSSIQSLRGDQ